MLLCCTAAAAAHSPIWASSGVNIIAGRGWHDWGRCVLIARSVAVCVCWRFVLDWCRVWRVVCAECQTVCWVLVCCWRMVFGRAPPAVACNALNVRPRTIEVFPKTPWCSGTTLIICRYIPSSEVVRTGRRAAAVRPEPSLAGRARAIDGSSSRVIAALVNLQGEKKREHTLCGGQMLYLKTGLERKRGRLQAGQPAIIMGAVRQWRARCCPPALTTPPQTGGSMDSSQSSQGRGVCVVHMHTEREGARERRRGCAADGGETSTPTPTDVLCKQDTHPKNSHSHAVEVAVRARAQATSKRGPCTRPVVCPNHQPKDRDTRWQRNPVCRHHPHPRKGKQRGAAAERLKCEGHHHQAPAFSSSRLGARWGWVGHAGRHPDTLPPRLALKST